MKLTTFLLVFTLICSCNDQSKNVKKNVKLIYNAAIIDVVDGNVSKNKALLIKDNKIEAIGVYDDLKQNVPSEHSYNIEGKFIIPGLWDMHSHIDKLSHDIDDSKLMLQLYTINGVTSIREMGGDWERLSTLKNASKEELILPNIYTAGPILENKAFVDWVVKNDNDVEFGKQRIGISNPEEVSVKIDSILNLGIDFVKIRTAASPEVFFEVANQCYKKGVKFCGHVDAKVELYDAIKSGISSIEHLDIFQLNGMTDQGMDSIVEVMKQKKTYYCPTLVYFKKHRIHDKDSIEMFLLDSLNKAHPQRAFASKRLLEKSIQAFGWAKDSKVPWKDMEPNFIKFGNKLVNNGVPIIAGTDGANALVLPGFSLVEELQLYKTEFGMSNLDILKTATINPAAYFGFDNQGVIKEGNLADLVVLDENPLEDIANIKKVYAVVKNGQIITKGKIDSIKNTVRAKNLAE